MAMSGFTGGMSDFFANSLLAEIGLAYQPGLLNGPITDFAMHPISEGISSVTFAGGYHVGEVAGVMGGVNTVVASHAGAPVGMAQERGGGRVFIWGDEWIEFDSEWQSLPQIKQFWVNITGWLGRFK
jgi:hypothetical protein